ncbi:MAG: class I SAM-dependent methyltransferase [bacterium]|nr:class I SAM-dependent methyltransferase [bacterium]
MIKMWRPKKIGDVHDSPGRAYADRFFYEELHNLLLKKEISMLDIGCGSGYVRKIFHDAGYALSYLGVDVAKHKDFEQYNHYTQTSDFIKTKIEDFNTSDKYDVVFSNCALEHIEHDALAARKSLEFSKNGGMVIHTVPAFWSLFLYLRHGYRRYSIRRLKKMFGGNIDIYKLGGVFSFFLHLFFITIPEVFLKTNALRQSAIYPALLGMASKLDRAAPVWPSFYIVISKKIEFHHEHI